MASIVLDPRLLAAPAAGSTADEFYSFVDRLLEWSNFGQQKGAALAITQDAASKLAEDNAYPMPKSLADEMWQVGIREYDLPTLKQLCDRFLNPKVTLQQHLRVRGVLCDGRTINPSLPAAPSLPATTEEAECNAVALAVLNHCQCSNVYFGFALEHGVGVSEVSVRAILHDIEHDRDDLGGLATLPSPIAGAVSVCSSLAEYALACDFGRLLVLAGNDDQMILAIRLAILGRRRKSGADTDWDNLPEVFVGEEFRERAQAVARLGPSHGANVVETVVDLYESTNEQQTHWLRTGPGGGNPQRIIRRFGAWRRDVANDVHVHYWKGPNGKIELSWVSHPHDDFYIADGTNF